MKKLIFLLLSAVMFLGLASCDKVPAGNVGIKYYLLGGDKGVDSEELKPGRYWIGVNEELFLFPTFTQNVVWTADDREGSENNESITFQTSEGMKVGADIGLSYHIDPTKVDTIFQKYKRGIDEITDIFLRNMIRDSFVAVASNMKVQDVYGSGKQQLIANVEKSVRAQTDPLGIVIEKVYLVQSFRLPTQVTNALNAKVEATQMAEQRENEIRQAEAEAKKVKAVADGQAAAIESIAQGKANAILLEAKAQAKANNLLKQSLSNQVIQYEATTRWNGILPTTMFAGKGGATPFIKIGK